MTFAPNYFTSKMWEKVGRQELGSTPSKQEMDPRGAFQKSWAHDVKRKAFSNLG
jgi:hypothetical protein